MNSPVFGAAVTRSEVAADGIDASKEGTDWTADEVGVLVGSYFLMLAQERAGRDYNKSEYRRNVIAAIGRNLWRGK